MQHERSNEKEKSEELFWSNNNDGAKKLYVVVAGYKLVVFSSQQVGPKYGQ